MTSFLTRLASRFSAIYQRPARLEESARVSVKLQQLAEALVEVKRAIGTGEPPPVQLHPPKKNAQREMMRLKMSLHRAEPARTATPRIHIDAPRASQAIERSMGLSPSIDFRQLLHGGRHYHVVGNAGLPRFLGDQLRQLSEGNRATYLAGTQSHAFTLVLHHAATQAHEPAHYLIHVYSPGAPHAHTKLRIHQASETERLSNSRFCTDPSRPVAASAHDLTLFIEVPSPTTVGGPTTTRVRTYASPVEMCSPAYIQTLSCVDGGAEIKQFFQTAGKHVPPGLTYQLLSADAGGTRSALFQAATHGSSAVVDALMQSTIDAWTRRAITTEDVERLFTGDSNSVGTAHVLFRMLSLGHADTIQVYLAALVNAHQQGLITKPLLIRLLIAPGPDGLTGLSMSLHKNQTAARKVYVEALYAAVQENIISENDLHTIFTQGQYRPHPST